MTSPQLPLYNIAERRSQRITSRFDKWMIAVDDNTGTPTLYHKNKGRHRGGTSESPIPNYHLQPSSGHSIPVIFKSIFTRDQHKGSNPFIELPKKAVRMEPNREKRKTRTEKNAKMHRIKARIEKDDYANALLIFTPDYSHMAELIP